MPAYSAKMYIGNLKTTRMEMRAAENIEIGQDITPPLRPLSSALHHSFLSSHCSSCFSPLPLQPFTPHNSHHLLLYCSSLCSASDSPLHISSAEPHLLRLLQSRPDTYPHSDSSDLRAALRLLPATCPPVVVPARISGLLTNRSNLTDDQECLRIRDGARAMFLARKMKMMQNDAVLEEAPPDDAVFELEEAALCLVLTNAVEVQDKTGRTLGVSVYPPTFSWINHSCSPNASYRFLLSAPPPPQPQPQPPLLIVPSAQGTTSQIETGVWGYNIDQGVGYGPRMIVRSIKRINKGEEVTVTYTDLLQPKALRQSELWSRYRFICCCRRCSASPLVYVDCVLEEISAVSFKSSRLCSEISFDRDKATQRLTDYVDDAIADYLSIGDPKSSCEKLEHLLTQGLSINQSVCSEETTVITCWLNPFHHLSLNAYTTLASAYKVLADDLYSEIDNNLLKAFDRSRSSAAYSLFLACAAHHLFVSESSLVLYVANFWRSAGESLLNLSRSSVWSEFVRCNLAGSDDSDLYPIEKHICPECSLIDKFESDSFYDQVTHPVLEHVSIEFIDCITNLTQKVWNFLVQGCTYLNRYNNPLDFCGVDCSIHDVEGVLASPCGTRGNCNCGNRRSISGSEEDDPNQLRICIIKLSVHCLLYGKCLSRKCYGGHFYLSSPVHNTSH